jgi:hypothetical protein
MMTKRRACILVCAMFVAGAGLTSAKPPRKPAGPTVRWRELPAPVQATIQANLAAGKVKEVHKETGNGFTFYYAEVKGADGKWSKVYVKEAGDLMKVEPDSARNKRKHKPLFGD